jgi:DNA-binding MarR family transcriptional regulator
MLILRVNIAGVCVNDSGFDTGGAEAGPAGGGDGGGDKDDSARRSSDRANVTARIWRDLLQFDERLHKQKNIRLLTPEARVLLHLKLNGPVSVTAAMQMAGTSYRGFYAVLERLKQAGIISTVKDQQDQRVRKLSIDPSAPRLP